MPLNCFCRIHASQIEEKYITTTDQRWPAVYRLLLRISYDNLQAAGKTQRFLLFVGPVRDNVIEALRWMLSNT